jgi:hypothetical protein
MYIVVIVDELMDGNIQFVVILGGWDGCKWSTAKKNLKYSNV